MKKRCMIVGVLLIFITLITVPILNPDFSRVIQNIGHIKDENVDLSGKLIQNTPLEYIEEWNQLWGGGARYYAHDVVVDNEDNCYIIGSTNAYGANDLDILLIKYDDSGNQLWSKTFGSAFDEHGYSATIDLNDNIYVTGNKWNAKEKNYDALFLKCDKDGNLLLNITWGGMGDDHAMNIAVDDNGSVLLTGYIMTTGEAFLVKFDVAGNKLWERIWKSNQKDRGYSITTDKENSIYIAGLTFKMEWNAYRAFLVKFDPIGHQEWNKTVGPLIESLTENTFPLGLAIDDYNNLYMASSNYTHRLFVGRYAFLYKFDGSGNQLWNRSCIQYGIWSHTGNCVVDHNNDVIIMGNVMVKFDGNGNELWNETENGYGNSISVDSNNCIYLVRKTIIVGEGNDYRIFLMKFNTTGGQLWNRTWGESDGESDIAVDITKDADGNIYVAGCTDCFGAGDVDAVLLKYNCEGYQLWNRTWGNFFDDYGMSVSLDENNNVYLAGYTNNTGNGLYYAMVIQFDSSGNQLWNRTWCGMGNSYGSYVISKGNEIYLVGYNESNLSSDIFVVKYDSTGNHIWNQTWNGNTTDYIYGGFLDKNNNLLLAGYTGGDALLVKYDPSGNQIWNRTWGGSSEEFGRALGLDESDNIYLTGDREEDIFLVKFNSTGYPQWNQSWGKWVCTSYDIVNGSVIICGSKKEIGYDLYVDIENNIFILGQSSYEFIVLQYDSQGNLLNNQTFFNYLPYPRGIFPPYATLTMMTPMGGIIDENYNLYLIGYMWYLLGTEAIIAKYRLRHLISPPDILISNKIRQNEPAGIELSINRIIKRPINVNIEIFSSSFQNYSHAFILKNDSINISIKLQYLPRFLFDHGNRELNLTIYSNNTKDYSFSLLIQVKLSYFSLSLIFLFVAIGAVATTGVFYQIRKTRKKKSLIQNFINLSKNKEIPISLLATHLSLDEKEVLEILTDLVHKNQVIGIIKKDVFHRKPTKIDLTAFNEPELKFLNRYLSVIPPEIYNEILQLSLSDEEKSLIFEEISRFPPEATQKIFKKFKTFQQNLKHED